MDEPIITKTIDDRDWDNNPSAATIGMWTDQAHALLEDLAGTAFIAGGMARWMNMGQDAPLPGDIDIFQRYQDNTSHINRLLLTLGYVQTGRQGNSTGWVHNTNHGLLHLQVIDRISNGNSHTFGDPVDVIKMFTFTTEMFAVERYDRKDYHFVGPRAEADTLDRVIHLNHITCPVGAVSRMLKYQRKGYTIPLHEVVSLFIEWDQRPLQWKADILAADQAANLQDLYRLTTLD